MNSQTISIKETGRKKVCKFMSINTPVYLGEAFMDNGNPAGITKSDTKRPDGEKLIRMRTHRGCRRKEGIRSLKEGCAR
jgi:hypothetical protein